MKWEDCIDKKIAKESSIDKDLISSLIQSSDRKLKTDKYSPLSNITASTKISNNYDSLREILEALSISNGFKIYNHECFVGFISDILKKTEESIQFDKLRKIRNDINYYGKDISTNHAKELILEINNLRNKFLKILNDKKN